MQLTKFIDYRLNDYTELINRFIEIDTCFIGLELETSMCVFTKTWPHVFCIFFQSIIQKFGKFKIICPNQTR